MDLDAFALIAELSLGLLGFSGVAAAFGGRERSFNYVERIRLRGIVLQSSVPLFGSLAIYALSSAGLGPSEIASRAAGISVVLFLPAGLMALPAVIRSGRDSATTTEKWAVAVVWVQMAVVLSLYAITIVGGGIPWSLIASYACHLAMGVFIFWRILMRPA